MRNVYVAGKTDDYENVRSVQELCRRVGLHVTHDWTETVEANGAGLKGKISDELRREFAYADAEGVREADLLIMLCSPGLCGTLIEFGIAAEREMPIVVVGTPERDSVFFELEDVSRCEDILDLEDHLEVNFGLLVPQDD